MVNWGYVSLGPARARSGFAHLREPGLAIALLRVMWRFRRRGWYRHVPFLPLPDREYLRWRMYTAYGDANSFRRPTTSSVMRDGR